MKIYPPIIAIATAALLLALTGTVIAAPADAAGPLTIAHSSRIEHDNLLREFSQGLGVDLPGQRTLVAAAVCTGQ